MPEVCRFFGIVIRMFYNDHEPPHFHAFYGGKLVRINIETLTWRANCLLARSG
jgi:hypothetical protein